MADWIAFFVVILEECISWLTSVQLLGVPVLGIMAGFFLLGVIFRILYRA